MTHSQLIDKLGGTSEVAKYLGEEANTVSNWRHRGIPWKWRGKLTQLAAGKRIRLPAGFNDASRS